MPTHFQGTADEVRALDLLIKLSRAASSLGQRLESPLEASGLTASQFGVLEALWHLGPLCLTDLAKKLLKTGGNLTLVVRNLEREGLVKRTRSKQDLRYFQVALTAKGEKTIRKVFPQHLRRLVESVKTLQSAEQQELARLCKKLGRGLESS
ncbi:MAG TPA: MarR family transcriptional regulator [Terriglobales bacterium]|nr:MarR family transcriptional regulator [Terriglobales bacterium]